MDKLKWMYFLIEHDDLLEKYNTIWDKVSAGIKKEFNREPVYNKISLKAKIKYCGNSTFLAVKVFLKVCKCLEKEKK